LSRQEVVYILNEVHAEVCGAHQADPKLDDQIEGLGYYWSAMVQDVEHILSHVKLVKYM